MTRKSKAIGKLVSAAALVSRIFPARTARGEGEEWKPAEKPGAFPLAAFAAAVEKDHSLIEESEDAEKAPEEEKPGTDAGG